MTIAPALLDLGDAELRAADDVPPVGSAGADTGVGRPRGRRPRRHDTGAERQGQAAAAQRTGRAAAKHPRVERLDQPRYAAFRWLGRAGEEGAGTLTEFWLDEGEDSVTLRVVESGLDNIPEERREAYLRDNTHGWEAMLAAARVAAEAT